MDQLLIALDVDSAARARTLVDTLRGVGGGFKIGSELFTAEGPGLVRDVVDRGARVFLDLKFHDIPTTVAGAVRGATRLGVWMLNVHASGGRDMMRAARDAAADEAARQGRARPLVIAVTVLTSLDDAALAGIGVARGTAGQVEALATAAQEAGLDGVVASPREIGIVRRACGDKFLIVTPGIREKGPDPFSQNATRVFQNEKRGQAPFVDDQVRPASAREAIAAGANYIVVGRPIIAAADPRAAAERLSAECA